MNVYRKPSQAKVLITFLLVVFTALAVYLDVTDIIKNHYNLSWYNYLLPVVTLFMPGLLWCEIITWKLEFTDDSVISSSLLQRQELKFSDIKGYTTKDGVLSLEPKDRSDRSIMISDTVEDSDGNNNAVQYVSERFADLGERIELDDDAEVIQNDVYGETEEIRKDRLKKAKVVSVCAHVGAIAVAIWLFKGPVPELFNWLPCFIYPIALYYVYLKFEGIIKIAPRKYHYSMPTIGMAIGIPIFAMGLKTTDHTFPDSRLLWLGSFLIGGIFTLAFFYNRKQVYKRERIWVLAIVMYIIPSLIFYGYSLLVFINCTYDNSQWQHYQTTVTNKYTSVATRSRRTYYNLVLAPYGPVKEGQTISTNRIYYDTKEIGDIVPRDVRSGALGIPWY